MKNFITIVIALFAIYNVHAQQLPSVSGNKSFTYKIIPSENKTWGYDIYDSGKLFIHQPSIPALSGNKGFTTKAAAEKVAKKVMEKIENGESPPTVSIDEIKELGAIPK